MEEVYKFRAEANQSLKNKLLFRRMAKLNMAQNVSSQFDLQTLLANTIYVIPNSNKLYIDYLNFKLYANPSNYEYILNYFMQFFQGLDTVDTLQYEFHINMQTLSASACERYKEIILQFFQTPGKDECLRKISRVVVYNTPSVVDILCNIVLKFMKNDEIIPSIFYDKAESEVLLKELLGE